MAAAVCGRPLKAFLPNAARRRPRCPRWRSLPWTTVPTTARPPCWTSWPARTAACGSSGCRTAASPGRSMPVWTRRGASSSPAWTPTTWPIRSVWPCRRRICGNSRSWTSAPAVCGSAAMRARRTALPIMWTGRTAYAAMKRWPATAFGTRRSATLRPCSAVRPSPASAVMPTATLPRTGSCGCAGSTPGPAWKNCRRSCSSGTIPPAD